MNLALQKLGRLKKRKVVKNVLFYYNAVDKNNSQMFGKLVYFNVKFFKWQIKYIS